MLKVVEIDEDIPILDYLCSPALRADKRNHTVPILDKIPVPDEVNRVWIVMPYLLRFQAFVHPFNFVSEIVECIEQFLEVGDVFRTWNTIFIIPTCNLAGSGIHARARNSAPVRYFPKALSRILTC